MVTASIDRDTLPNIDNVAKEEQNTSVSLNVCTLTECFANIYTSAMAIQLRFIRVKWTKLVLDLVECCYSLSILETRLD